MQDVDLSELERYLRIYQENPDSRVFAPLADLYRRLGRLEDAEQICRDGIRRHPYYAGGRVALAHVLLDKGVLSEALKESEAVVTYYPDNLLARKLLVRSLGMSGHLERAKRELEALRFLAPMVAEDPELLRALQGQSAIKSQNIVPPPLAMEMAESPFETQENTQEFQSFEEIPVERTQEYYVPTRKDRLLKQKRILEGLILRLGTPRSFG